MSLPPLPSGLRTRVFATDELILDICHALQKLVPADLESIVMLACVSEATIRPLLLGPHAPLHLIDDPHPPNELRGAISRRAIAERTGFARETVRRKVEALVKANWLEEDNHGQVRTPPTLDQPEVQKTADDIYAAVKRYEARLRQFSGVASDAR